MSKLIIFIGILLLAGCDSSIVNNSGALPPIEFKGSVWAGNVRNAKIQFVGVDQYGQPQRKSDGSFYGDSYSSDDKGAFSGAIQGAYTGSLVAVASYNSNTKIRCVLPNGCAIGASPDVAYGEWFSAPEDFEMWGAVSSVTGLEVFNITPITHLAVKHAFNQMVSDGTSCDNASCIGDTSINAILTPELIYEANHRLKQFFKAANSLHINITPWYADYAASDSVSEIESAKHGLLSMALQKNASDKDESMMTTLDSWVAAFLENDGNFYEETVAVGDIDFKEILQAAVNSYQQYDAEGLETTALTSASSTFDQLLTLLVVDDLLDFTEVTFDSIDGKVSEATVLVGKIIGWAMDLKDNNYTSFFDDDIAADIVQVENSWEEYNEALSPAMKGLFRPIIKFAEYGLNCLRPDGCDAAHELNAYITYSASNDSISLNESNTTITLDGDSQLYSAITLDGSFDSDYTQELLKRTFVFSSVVINTIEGDVTIQSSSDTAATIVFWLDESLQSGVEPAVSRIDLNLPVMTVESNTTTEVYELVTDNFFATLLGTKDAADNSSPMHFNLLNIHLEGEFSQKNSSAKLVDVRATINSANADTYYSPNRFPDLEINIDSGLFKDYASFDESYSDDTGFALNQGGWFTLPGNIMSSELPVFEADGVTVDTPGQTIEDAITFYDRGDYDSLGSDYSALKSLLDITYTADAKLGTLEYPGGETALILFKDSASSSSYLAQQCNRVGESWGCVSAQSLSNLGCGTAFGVGSATVIETFNFLKQQSCIDQVKIDGRGVYEINYGDKNVSFTDNPSDPVNIFDVSLLKPDYLGIDSFYVSLISRFKDAQNDKKPTILLTVNGTAPDINNITVSFSMTHNYVGGESSSVLGVDSLIPYGDNSIWLAVGHSSTEQDALIYYIQDENITLTVFGFDYGDDDSTTNSSHSKALAVVRYDGQLLGTLRKEGDLYVIRYINGKWQVL